MELKKFRKQQTKEGSGKGNGKGKGKSPIDKKPPKAPKKVTVRDTVMPGCGGECQRLRFSCKSKRGCCRVSASISHRLPIVACDS